MLMSPSLARTPAVGICSDRTLVTVRRTFEKKGSSHMRLMRWGSRSNASAWALVTSGWEVGRSVAVELLFRAMMLGYLSRAHFARRPSGTDACAGSCPPAVT